MPRDKFYNVAIVSAFPGMGKSYCALQMSDKNSSAAVIDMESSEYHWIQDTPDSKKELDHRWPNNYIESIITKATMLSSGLGGNKGGIIFISSHKEVIEGLHDIFNTVAYVLDTKADSVYTSAYFLYKEKYISFSVVVPSKDRLDEFVDFYKKRGNTEEFIEKLTANWENFIDDACSHNVTSYTIHKGHIGDYVAPLICSKYEDDDTHNVILTMGINTYEEISFVNVINRPLFESIHMFTIRKNELGNFSRFKLTIKHRNRVSKRSRFLYVVELVDKEAAEEFIDFINNDETYPIYKSCNFTFI